MADFPIVCTLSNAELNQRQGMLLPGLVRHAESVEATADGCRLRFAPSADVLRRIVDAIDAERQCCRFLRFELVVEAGLGPITLTLIRPGQPPVTLMGPPASEDRSTAP